MILRPCSCVTPESRWGGGGQTRAKKCTEARARTHLCRPRGRNQGHYSWGHGRITTAANDRGRDPTAAAGAVVLRLCSCIPWKQRWGVGDQIRDFKNTHKSARRTFVRIAAALNSTAVRGSPIVSYPPLSLHLEQNRGGGLRTETKMKRNCT